MSSAKSMNGAGAGSAPLWFSAFILLLVFVPFPFGSNRPWASDLLAVVSGLLLGLMLFFEHDSKLFAGTPPRKRLWASAAGFTLVTIWSFLQVVSWTPTTWHHPIWQEASAILGPMSGSVSVDTGAFPESVLRFVSYIACFLLAFVGARRVSSAKLLVKSLAYAGVAYALYGLIAQSAGADSILWYKKWAYEGFLTSTFVNKNSYAAYAGLGLLCCLAMLWDHFRAARSVDPVLQQRAPVAAFLATLKLKDFVLMALPLVFLAALALTGSRAGVASTLLGIGGFVAAMTLNRRWPLKKWLMLLGGCGVIFLFFVAVGGEALIHRVDKGVMGEDAATRMTAYTLVMQAIHDNPFLGYGLGSFDSAFRLYRDASLDRWFHHAHNDYLEMAMDLGIPLALVLFASIALVVSCCVEGAVKRVKDGVYPALAVGATALIASHALVDFSMHIPAIAATYAALLGIGVAQSWSSRKQEGSRPALPAKSLTVKRKSAMVRPLTIKKVAETQRAIEEPVGKKPAAQVTPKPPHKEAAPEHTQKIDETDRKPRKKRRKKRK